MAPQLILSRPWPEDAAAIAAALADWQVTQWLTAARWPYGAEDAAAFVAGAGLDEHAVRQGDRLIGMVRAGQTFGIWIAPDQQRRGAGLRAAVLALSRRFLAGAQVIEATHLEGNAGSARLMQRLGFRQTGTARLWSQPQGRHLPGITLQLSRADFARLHGVRLTTPRLLIDAVRQDDLPALQRIATAPEVARNLLRFRPGMADEAFAAIFEGDGLLPPMRLVVRHQGQVAGSVGISGGAPGRIFYFLDHRLAGQGLGQEMVAAFLAEIVARFDPQELLADVFLDNPASRRLLKNLGFLRYEDQMLASMAREAPAPAAIYRWHWRSQLKGA
ncbi:GNAT family N-acetyltransferase [Paracoccus spongiarum]|uniref:GNAT family N-acetyltransferase n=1 Tax=Paracoccus spongiarum TaxID=3064387 RepID=A0ABT9JA95_9RHOB|nr:GNAT family N-acetyltransferase [Paracoccus sp. 2205BS29-5]MDP5306016.1 GNAT family N-acetyltransferase [Paracoccus sp. 2205BS29-5]